MHLLKVTYQPIQILVVAESAVLHKSLTSQFHGKEVLSYLSTIVWGMCSEAWEALFLSACSAQLIPTHHVCVALTACGAKHSAFVSMQPKGCGSVSMLCFCPLDGCSYMKQGRQHVHGRLH